jgi:hypothetical protein
MASTGAPSNGMTCDRPQAASAIPAVHTNPGPTARGLHLVTSRQ